MGGAGASVFAVWGWVLAHAGSEGELVINPRVVAAAIGMDVKDVNSVIDWLKKPDPSSRNEEEEGRRLICERGMIHRIVTHESWKKLRTAEERRAYNREKKRESRARKASADSVKNGQTPSNSVNDQKLTGQHGQPLQIQRQNSETETETEKNKASAPPARTRSRLPPSPQAIEIAQHLFDSISAHSAHLYQGDSPAQIEKRLVGWTVHIGRALKHDAMTVEGARLCIDYAHHESDPSRSGSFSWHTNLLSGQALRKQWQQKKLLADATRWRDAPKAERPGYVPPMKFTEANARVRAFLGED